MTLYWLDRVSIRKHIILLIYYGQGGLIMSPNLTAALSEGKPFSQVLEFRPLNAFYTAAPVNWLL